VVSLDNQIQMQNQNLNLNVNQNSLYDYSYMGDINQYNQIFYNQNMLINNSTQFVEEVNTTITPVLIKNEEICKRQYFIYPP
jgi:hypothetical protein